MVTDSDGKEWLCVNCYCAHPLCGGKAARKVNGKTELSKFDRGKEEQDEENGEWRLC